MGAAAVILALTAAAAIAAAVGIGVCAVLTKSGMFGGVMAYQQTQPTVSAHAMIFTAVLHQKLDLDEIMAVLRTRRLRWYGHVQRATSCINSIT